MILHKCFVGNDRQFRQDIFKNMKNGVVFDWIEGDGCTAIIMSCFQDQIEFLR